MLAVLGIAAIAVTALAFANNTKPTGAGKAGIYRLAGDPFTCANGATVPNPAPPTVGFVVLNTNSSGELIAQVSLKNGLPEQDYDIYVNQNPGDCPTTPTGVLTTNKQGNGNAHVVEPRVPTATHFWVSAYDPDTGDILRSTAVVLD